MSYNEILNLNVGGTKFVTSRQTLMREPGSLLGRMFDLDSPLQPAAMLQQDGAFFLDRDPEKFKIILNYLREDELALLTKVDLSNLKIEARYFQLTNLEAEINKRLDEMEVYKFRDSHNGACLEVKKSYFRNVSLDTIVKFACRNYAREKACMNRTTSVKDFFDNEIISLTVPNRFELNVYIKLVRHHLVLYDEYIRVKSTHIKINICGHLFVVNISAALKDGTSDFSSCWNNTGHCSEFMCFKLAMDENANIQTLDICHCNKSSCRSYPVHDDDVKPVYCDKEMITKSLQKLETCNIVRVFIDDERVDERRTEIDEILCQMGFLGDYSILEDV